MGPIEGFILGATIAIVGFVMISIAPYLFMALAAILWDNEFRGSLLFVAFIVCSILWGFTGFEPSILQILIWISILSIHILLSNIKK